MPDEPQATAEAYERYTRSVDEQRVAIGERVPEVTGFDSPQAILDYHYLPYLEGWLMQFTNTDLDTFLQAIQVWDDGLANNNCNPSEAQWTVIDETIARCASIGLRRKLTPDAFSRLVQDHNAKKQQDAQRNASRDAQRAQRDAQMAAQREERERQQAARREAEQAAR